MHAVQRLHQYRESIATRPFKGRGYKVERCENCRISIKYCICLHKPQCHSDAAFLLLMWDDEVLKPSNTGRLIADLVDDTHAFIWQRTEVDPKLLALINDPQYQPFVVFPQVYAHEGQTIVNHVPPLENGKRPLFILLDGTWREAKKMYRKSPYLNGFPLLSINLEQQSERYRLRKAITEGQLATAEVAAQVLYSFGESDNAQLLDLWFDVFSYYSQQGASQRHQGNEDALEKLQRLAQTISYEKGNKKATN
ncbi:tRNA-uridine aminocarboxypropyltransferase [Psychrobium sp. 1_MG-2023]|uniref:tRNA-uridine aminocarboxypropyltransferase n=1 Tax=Psychrobium sp. 1_MG-2023 TaxID=3062624 RepID=UPI000C346487|nr:tRNA-uridine aminocarboxypropyltransferase [Psychrobium sp. 1_MG-2023]MDP2562309.1 tRNA-uridine aminocarboxypropyltransferase [Psychrobium sp. 1_MG-2023]PKF54691.1 DTW domain-containing protein [Alteromonadales bacterium alter-6D02]